MTPETWQELRRKGIHMTTSLVPLAYGLGAPRGWVLVRPEGGLGPNEHGGRYRDENYDRRPFMGPALQKERPKLPSRWANSLRGG